MSEKVVFVRRIHFSAAHAYAKPGASFEENKKIYGSSAKPDGLGHNFKLEAHFQGEVDATTGMIINLSDIDSWLKKMVEPLDHHHLNNDVEFFRTNVATAENIARYCFESLKAIMKSSPAQHKPKNDAARLLKVRLYEGENLWVDYSDSPIENE